MEKDLVDFPHQWLAVRQWCALVAKKADGIQSVLPTVWPGSREVILSLCSVQEGHSWRTELRAGLPSSEQPWNCWESPVESAEMVGAWSIS